MKKIEKIKKYLSEIRKPWVMILIGPPLSGKDTFIKLLDLDDCLVISRDQIILDMSGGKDYNTAFNEVDSKEVDRELMRVLLESSESKKNIIINMTHMKSNRRSQNLRLFRNHYKIGVIFPIISDREFEIRNKKRKDEENKFIPMSVIKNMIESYEPISTGEGFDKIITI